MRNTNSIEKLSNITEPEPSDFSEWQLIQPNQSFQPRFSPVFCACNDQELIILGGEDSNGPLSDGWVLDSRTDIMTQVIYPTADSPQIHT